MLAYTGPQLDAGHLSYIYMEDESIALYKKTISLCGLWRDSVYVLKKTLCSDVLRDVISIADPAS